jgi:hypothetical protein
MMSALLLCAVMSSSCSEQSRTGLTDAELNADNTVPPSDVMSFTSIDGDDGTFANAINFSRTPGTEEIDRIVFRGNISMDGSGSAPANCNSGTLLHTENGPFTMGADSVTEFDLDDNTYYHIRVCLYDDADNETTAATTVTDNPGTTTLTIDRPFGFIIHLYSDSI